MTTDSERVASKQNFAQAQRRGKLVKAIYAAFEVDPDNAYTTADIAMRVYGVGLQDVTRAHRVAVQRAIKRACEIEPRFQSWRGEGPEGQTTIFDCTRILSYAMQRQKTNAWNRYQWTAKRAYYQYGSQWQETLKRRQSEKRLRDELADERHQSLMNPGGAWHRDVQQYIAELTGDEGTLERLHEEQERAMAAHVNKLRGALGKDTEKSILQSILLLLARLEAVPRTDDDWNLCLDEEKSVVWRLTRIVASEDTADRHNDKLSASR